MVFIIVQIREFVHNYVSKNANKLIVGSIFNFVSVTAVSFIVTTAGCHNIILTRPKLMLPLHVISGINYNVLFIHLTSGCWLLSFVSLNVCIYCSLQTEICRN